jgi:hypothetical protein
MDHEKRASFGQIQSSHEAHDTARSIERGRLADLPILRADLHESIHDALRSAARALRHDGTNGEPDERSRAALNLVCTLARRDELHAEQLLVALKDAWRRLPEVQSAPRTDADVTLACVVTHCIEEFYRPSKRN